MAASDGTIQGRMGCLAYFNIFQHASDVDRFEGIMGYTSGLWSNYLRTWLNRALAEALAFTGRAFGLFGIDSRKIGQSE